MIRLKFIKEIYKIHSGNNFYIININNNKDEFIIKLIKLEKQISNYDYIKLDYINIPLLLLNNKFDINKKYIIIEIYKNKIYILNNIKQIYIIENNILYKNNKILGYVILNKNNKILDILKFIKYKNEDFNSISNNNKINNYFFNTKNKKYKINNIIDNYKL